MTLLQVQHQPGGIKLASRHDEANRVAAVDDLRVGVEGGVLGGDLGRVLGTRDDAGDAYRTFELDDAAVLLELPVVAARGPVLVRGVLEPHDDLLHVDEACLRQLLHLLGIECVNRGAVRSGLDQVRLLGRVARVGRRLFHRHWGSRLALPAREYDDAHQQRDKGEDGYQAIGHRRALRSKYSHTSRTAPLPPRARVVWSALRRTAGTASATAKESPTCSMSGRSGRSSPTQAHSG